MMEERELLKEQVKRRAVGWMYKSIFFAILMGAILVWNSLIVLYGKPNLLNYLALFMCPISMQSWEKAYRVWMDVYNRN